MPMITIIRGGGDLASGVAIRLHRAGLRIIMAELPYPLAVRRSVSFSEAVYAGETEVEGVRACCVANLSAAWDVIQAGQIAVMVDPGLQILESLPQNMAGMELAALIDGRMAKRPPDLDLQAAPLIIGLGPGFVAG